MIGGRSYGLAITSRRRTFYTRNDPPDPLETGNMAARVARWMTSRVERRDWAEHRIYDDGRLRILLGMQEETLEVFILRDSGETEVFRAVHPEWSNPELYHPGGWTRHLEELDNEARELEERAEQERLRALEREREGRFTPIDDSDIFRPQQDCIILKYVTAIRIAIEVERHRMGYLAVFRPNAGTPVSAWDTECPARAVEKVRGSLISKCLDAKGGINLEDSA